MMAENDLLGKLLRPVKPLNKRGLLVAIEGIDSSGKTTIVSTASAALSTRGVSTLTSNWNDTTEMYNLWVSLSLTGCAPVGLGSVFPAFELAARQHYLLKPMLEQRSVVFVTKYLLSTYAHSLARGDSLAFLDELYAFALRPDVTVYVDILPTVALERKRSHGRIGFFEAGLDRLGNLPLAEALQQFHAGRFDVQTLESHFLRFQNALREFHHMLLDRLGGCVLKLDGNAPFDISVNSLVRVVELELATSKAGVGVTDSSTASATYPQGH